MRKMLLCAVLLVVNVSSAFGDASAELRRAAWKNVIKVLLDAGADVRAQNDIGYTALMLAVMYNSNFEVIRLLIDGGSDVNAKEFAGGTVLMWAANDNHNPDIIDALIGVGADVNAKNRNTEVVRVLLEGGADVQAKTNYGNTILDYAEQAQNDEVKRVILNAVRQEGVNVP